MSKKITVFKLIFKAIFNYIDIFSDILLTYELFKYS